MDFEVHSIINNILMILVTDIDTYEIREIPKFDAYFQLDTIISFKNILKDFEKIFDLAICSMDYDNDNLN